MLQSIIFSGRLIRKRPLRSLLTIMQIALGVWIVATILTMNFQASDKVDALLDKFGENLVRISLEKQIEISESHYYGESRPFTSADLEDLIQSSPNIETAFIFEPDYMTNLYHNNLTYQLRGLAEVSADALSALELELDEGYYFTSADVANKNKVALISTELSKQLFPGQSAYGKSIVIGDRYMSDQEQTFEVIGVFKPLDPLLQIFFDETTMLIPAESRTGAEELGFQFDQDYYQIYIKSLPGAAFAAIDDAELLFGVDDFRVTPFYLSQYGKSFTAVILQMSLIMGALAFVAVIISALGILSIMLVNVVERTKEIGLRKALGASKLSIIHQILNESFIFAFFGALVGIGASCLSSGYIINTLLGQLFYSQMVELDSFHPTAALYSCLMALVLSLLFGLYPALQAARMPAVEALRDS